MKSRLTILAMTALFFGACSSGSYVTNPSTDDIYFNPNDVPPPIAEEEVTAEEMEAAKKSAHRMIISDINENEEGSQTMNNYIFDGTEEDAEALYYSMEEMETYDSDTAVYYNEDDVKYVINNYYDAEPIDYAYRIRRFHRPHFYDPFYWDDWYYEPYYHSPFYSSWYYPSWSWGWGSSWYSPYYYSGWGHYSPYYSSWYRPYNSGYYYGSPYYSSWYGYGNQHYVNSENYRYGNRRSTGTNVLYGSDNGRRSSTSAVRTSATATKSARDAVTGRSQDNSQVVRRGTSGTNVNTTTGNSVLTERRRTTDSQRLPGSAVKSGTTNSRTQTYTRPGSSTTRTYTRPSSGTTTTPRVVPQSNSTTNSYTRPKSSSSYNRTYRTNSTYDRSSDKNSSTRTYRPSSSSTRSGSSSESGSYRRSGSSSSGSYSRPSSSSGSYSRPSGNSSSGGSRSSSPSSSSSSGRRR